MKRWLAAAILGLSLAGVAHAAIDTYEFANDGERERFRELTKELRCPKCQNQDIADSNAPIAADLRKEIFRMLGEGKDNQQIIDFMVDRYGEFVRYNPALSSKTALLWFGPAGLLVRWFRRHCSDRAPPPGPAHGRPGHAFCRRAPAPRPTVG